MAERDLRAASREIEEQVPAADFDRIARRGHALRRRRLVAQTSGAVAAVVAAVVAGGTFPWGASPPVGPPPDPPITTPATAQKILENPRAVVRDDFAPVSDTGAVLQLVAVPSPAGGNCDADRKSVLVWQDGSGASVAWSEAVAGRWIEAIPGGFVVGAVLPECEDRVEVGDPAGAYVVGQSGVRQEVTWESGAESRCAPDPADPLCAVDVETASGELLTEPVRLTPDDEHIPLGADGADVWARSVNSRQISWSQDGGDSWQSHRTSLDPAKTSNMQVSAAGDWMVFYAWPEAEVTSDHGKTWQTRDLQEALSPILLAEDAITITDDGGLVGVSQPVGRRPVLFASTDDSWTEFVEADVRTAFGLIYVQTAGDWLWVPDQGRVWLSGDGGITWTVVDPLP